MKTIKKLDKWLKANEYLQMSHKFPNKWHVINAQKQTLKNVKKLIDEIPRYMLELIDPEELKARISG